jgi:hypothetical protein
MGTYGIKASRIGYDVDTASDRQLAFSSDWQLLPIEYEDTYTWGLDSEDLPYEHGLGYPPVARGWIEDTSGNVYLSEFDTPLIINSTYVIVPGIPKTGEYIDGEWILVPDSNYVGYKYHYKVFRRSLQTEYTAPVINISDATQQIDADYGILISLPGKDVDSSDDRDFCIRSDRRQLMVHQSGITAETVTRSLSFTASSASNGNTLISTTSVFLPSDTWKYVYNTVDYTGATIIEYVNSTTVKLSENIGDIWDGDLIALDNSSTIAVEHGLGYSPMFFAFLNTGGENWITFSSGADDAYVTVDQDIIYFTTYYDGYKWAYILFKDTLTHNG